MTQDALRAAEQAARSSYGRLVAILSARCRDVAAAEDALADAFRIALERWPVAGVPDSPDAWLLVTARHAMGHQRRRAVRHAAALPVLELAREEAEAAFAPGLPDRRLELLFVCAHEAIDPAARTPLMLQTVLGLDAARIARAFLVAPATMGQRLVRAKAKIRDAGIAFTLPEPDDLPRRLDAVLAAIYAAYGTGWEDGTDPHGQRGDLAEEAIWLGRLVVALLPDEPEARGLLALMLHCEARQHARRTAQGDFVPLREQDPARWSGTMIEEAEAELRVASRGGRIGRFQLEAAIQSVHAQRRHGGGTNWQALAVLYDALAGMTGAVGARVGQAAARAEVEGAQAGLALLDRLPAAQTAAYQPFWALRAHLLRQIGEDAAADQALALAIGLATDPAVRSHLQQSRAVR